MVVVSREERDARVLEIVRLIPRGAVASYGQVAALAGYPRHARHVAAALRSVDDATAVPWHRVISSDGTIPRRGGSDHHELQRLLLESEGVELDGGRVPMERYRWEPDRLPGRFRPGS